MEEIKLMLSKRSWVHLLLIDEFRTSQTCCKCLNKLTNMRGKSVRKKRDGSNTEILVHKVLPKQREQQHER